jgi:hypothetical protein
MHIQTVTKVRRPAQASEAVDIMETIATVLTTVATVLMAATGIVAAIKEMTSE